jgi:hypothetical protein
VIHGTIFVIPGFIVDPKQKGKKGMGGIKVELQFLQNHKDLYLELQCYIEFAIASRAAISAEPQGSVSGVTSRSFVGGGYLACT